MLKEYLLKATYLHKENVLKARRKLWWNVLLALHSLLERVVFVTLPHYVPFPSRFGVARSAVSHKNLTKF